MCHMIYGKINFLFSVYEFQFLMTANIRSNVRYKFYAQCEFTL